MVDHYKGSFFGRRAGKPASPRQSQLLQDILPHMALDLKQSPPENLAELFPVPVKSVCLEIGFGGSEHLIHRARENPEIGFIGCEPFSSGIVKAVSSIEEYGIKNIRLYDDDAGKLLDWLPKASLDMAYQLYPDPWPKKKHWKRRFVNQINLSRIGRALKPECEYRFASDIDTYVDWTLSHCRKHPAFEWGAECATDWRTPWENWPGTRYERKAHREGRVGRYLTFLRVSETET
ncbi:tRNA (guanine(46)-N(7))-methyltransferase TrmB [Pseudovibrio sp. Tun.PSC04-5.I4]|uniref:tRNA (guanine(46)-N(7))-methyltransferase TrmB n=1 Tax=Pseudovibrio sp. Tun.PSC04-5.I4 TaxID=1798213 RepID=UPI000B8824A5|nr:tRNA (guanine(46)-N(7))-methyltransferase TrmB [Pseudovibrio sp. Tun.PSC04-5.I4]